MGETTSSSRPRHSADDHDGVRALLPVYATALVFGHPAQTWYPAVAAHIASCASCRAELEELQSVVEPSYDGELTPAASTPQFDLSFLQPQDVPRTQPTAAAQQRAPRWQRDSGGRLLVPLSEYLTPGAVARPQFGLGRGVSRQRSTIELEVPEPVSIAIEVFNDDPLDMVVVQVQIDVATLDDPLSQAGQTIALRSGEHVWEAATNEAGVARIAGVQRSALADLHLEVELPPAQG